MKRGFTLVEIMVTVAVVSLLAVIATPTYSRIRGETRKVSCQNGQRLIRDAVDEWATAASRTNGAPVPDGAILAYIKGGQVPVCPEGNKAIAIPAHVGQAVRCPGRLPLHVVPDADED